MLRVELCSCDLVVLLSFSYFVVSEGCASAIKRILGKVEGVTDIQTNVGAQSVVIQHDESVSPDTMNEMLQKVRGCLIVRVDTKQWES